MKQWCIICITVAMSRGIEAVLNENMYKKKQAKRRESKWYGHCRKFRTKGPMPLGTLMVHRKTCAEDIQGINSDDASEMCVYEHEGNSC